MKLLVTTEKRHGKTRYRLHGDLDLGARPALGVIFDNLEEVGNLLRLDLAEVREIDLSGLSWLLRMETAMRERGGRLQIVSASPAVRRALQVLRPATHTLYVEESLSYRGRPSHRRIRPKTRLRLPGASAVRS